MNDRYCRPSRSRSAGFGLLTCVAVLAFAPAASAAEKMTICHATGSATNPYVQVTISENAVQHTNATKTARTSSRPPPRAAPP